MQTTGKGPTEPPFFFKWGAGKIAVSKFVTRGKILQQIIECTDRI